MVKINSKYLQGYIEDRLELLKGLRITEKDSSYKIQMMARIDELEGVLKEVRMLEEMERAE